MPSIFRYSFMPMKNNPLQQEKNWNEKHPGT